MNNNNNWKICVSNFTERSKNVLEQEMREWRPNPEKSIIALNKGDPLSFGNINPCKEILDSVIETLSEGKCNGYAPSIGYEDAREAIVNHLLQDGIEVEAKDIIICSGCSSCLDICITVLADSTKNHNILIPKPGAPIYRNIANSLSIPVRTYNLQPNNWNIDLADFESKIDSNTAAIIINNPSNPCGAVFSEGHLRDILEIARRHRVPIIADEIYSQIVYPEYRFTSAASLDIEIPILICGGISHGFAVPGWRLGWIAISDPIGAFDNVRKGLVSLSQRIIGCNTVIQGALGDILKYTAESSNEDLINTFRDNAKIVYDFVNNIEGLEAYMPKSTMFMLVKIDMGKFGGFINAKNFAKSLCEEESVICSPGEDFGIENHIRIVLTPPSDILNEALQRIQLFCAVKLL